MKRHRLIWLSPVPLLVALLIGKGVQALGEQTYLPGLGWIATPSANSFGQSEFLLDAPAASVATIAARHGLTVIRQLDARAPDVFLVSGSTTGSSLVPDGTTTDFVKQVQADPEVVHFEPNALAVTPEIPSGIALNQSTVEILDALSNRTLVSYYGDQAWVRYVDQPATVAIRLSDSHRTSVSGAGVVAIIDTGVDPKHPLLEDSLVPGYDFTRDVAGQASEWTDLDQSTVEILDQSTVEILDQQSVVPLNQSTVAILHPTTAERLTSTSLPAAFGHGTMVAGLVHLVAPTARIMPLKAFRADGTSRVSDIVRAIYYAVDNGARVINMSFSAVASSPEIRHAINVATGRGVICVSSAGNLGDEVLVYPGALRNVLGIGSTTSTSPPTRSLFSNYGDSLVSLGAPGQGLITTYPGRRYAGVWGTSFSTALVAGGAALLLQVDPALDQAKASDLFGKAEKMPSAGMGKGRLNLYDAVRSLPDETAPAVSMITPVGTGVLFGSVLVSASASDNVGVAGVKFLLDGNPLGPEDTAPPYELTWTTAAAANGAHTLTAVARDAAGNQTSSIVSVAVSNDTAAPAVVVTSPVAGATLQGTVTLAATASDDVGVVGVQFQLDGGPLGAEDSIAPYELVWDAGTATNGAHTVTAVARDAAGRQTTATSVSVTVANDLAAPTIAVTSPVAGATVSGMVALSATASDDVGVVGVQFKLDGATLGTEDTVAPYELVWNSATVANGAHTLAAVARDAAGKQTTATTISVTVANDTTAPTVTVTSPAAASSVTGTVMLTAVASDEVGVVGMQFKLDGASVGAEDAAAPYELAWNTLTVANGAHTVTAVARDAAGNQATASVSVTVANDTTAPTVTVTSPAAGTTVGGTVTLVATAADAVGVANVQFTLDGANLGAPDTAAPYELAWTTTSVANGVHTLAAVARDAAGNQATATSVSVTVAN